MSKLQWQIAQETQLLAEEEWIINALQLVKKERNSLQIERLNLESLKMQKFQKPQITTNTNTNVTSTSVIDIMKNFKESNNSKTMEFEEAMTSNCNGEELYLTCTNTVFDSIAEEEDMEEELELDFLLDMNAMTYTEPDSEKQHKIYTK